MADFTAHVTIHSIKIGFTFYLESVSLKVVHLPIACQSERSLRYFHLDRISDMFYFPHAAPYAASSREKIWGCLVVRKQPYAKKCACNMHVTCI